MAFYEFVCRPCGTDYLESMSMSDAGIVFPPCPLCGKPMDRRFSVPQVTRYPTSAELMEKAYRGEEAPPGMTKEDARKTAKTMAKRR